MEELRCVLEEIHEVVDPKEEHEEIGGGEKEEEEGYGGGDDEEEEGYGRGYEEEEEGYGSGDDEEEEGYGSGDEEEEEGYGSGGDEEEEGYGSGDDDYVDTQEEDDAEEWDGDEEYVEPYNYILPLPFCNAGANSTIEEAERITELANDRNIELIVAWCEMSNNNVTPLPTSPLVVLPEITKNCVNGYECYHRRYWTDNTSPTVPDHPNFTPFQMMQVFSLGLSTTVSHPVSIYGHFSVRDCWEPLRNHLFQRSRDDPATILPGCSLLPLCGPCRGIYVLQYILVEVDLWIKEEGDGSADKPLFHGCIELNTSLSGFDRMLEGRIHGYYYSLDMHFAFFSNSIESLVEIFAEGKNTSEVKIYALTSGIENVIALYDGTFSGAGRMVRHFLAINLQGELNIILKLNDSPYSWTFKAGVGVIDSPENPVTDFARFVVKVSFRTKGKAVSTWQWCSTCNDVRLLQW